MELGSRKRENNLVLEGRKAVVMWGFQPRKESKQQYSSLALVSVYFMSPLFSVKKSNWLARPRYKIRSLYGVRNGCNRVHESYETKLETQFKNSKLKFDSSSIEPFFNCLKLGLKNSQATRTRFNKARIN